MSSILTVAVAALVRGLGHVYLNTSLNVEVSTEMSTLLAEC